MATDSHRLSQRKVRLENVGERQVDVVIPGTSLTELSRMIGDVKDPVKIQVTDNQALFVFGNTRFYSRLLEGNYPQPDGTVGLPLHVGGPGRNYLAGTGNPDCDFKVQG